MQYLGKIVSDAITITAGGGSSVYYKVRVPQLHGVSIEDQEKIIQQTLQAADKNKSYNITSLTDDQLPRFLAPNSQTFEINSLVLVGFPSDDIRSSGIIIGAYGEVEELKISEVPLGSNGTSQPPYSTITGSVIIPGDITNWISGAENHAAFERGGSSGTQCVEIVHQYLEDCFGKPQDSNGNGMDVAGRVAERFPSEFTYLSYNDLMNQDGPREGDIISYNSGSSPQWGHVAIVSQTYNGSTYSIIHQWAGSITVQTKVCNIIAPQYGVSYSIIGVARPNVTTNIGSIAIPEGYGTIMTYMGAHLITSPSSLQYQMIQLAKERGTYKASTPENYATIDNRIMIATKENVGNQFPVSIGNYIEVTFRHADGSTSVHNCIIGDIKGDDADNIWGHQGGKCVTEIIYHDYSNDSNYGNNPWGSGKTEKLRKDGTFSW